MKVYSFGGSIWLSVLSFFHGKYNFITAKIYMIFRVFILLNHLEGNKLIINTC